MVLLKSYLFNIDGQTRLNEQVNLEDDVVVDNKVFNGNKMLDNVGYIGDLEPLLSINNNNNNNNNNNTNNTILGGTMGDVCFETINNSICSFDLSYTNISNNELYDILRKYLLNDYVVQEFDFNNNTKNNYDVDNDDDDDDDENLLNNKIKMYNLEVNDIIVNSDNNNANLQYNNVDTFDHKCSSCSNYLDIADVLWKPIVGNLDNSYLNFTCNELTQSYKALIEDLCKINYHTYDHFSMTEEEVVYNGLNINHLHAWLSGSYYGLGYFEPDSFFKNTFQCLYEVNELKSELNELFKDDKYYEDWKNKIELCAATVSTNKFGMPNKGDQMVTGKAAKIKHLVKSKWDYVSTSTRQLNLVNNDTPKKQQQQQQQQQQSPCSVVSPTKQKGSVLVSEIIERMNSKNSIGLFLPKENKELSPKPESNTFHEALRQNQSTISHVCGVTASTSSRHWTVAPNLFVINESHYAENNKMNTITGKINKKNHRDYPKNSFISNFEKQQVDPIGKKPSSMSFIQNHGNEKTDKNKRPNNSQNKNYANSEIQGFASNSEKLFEKTEYSIWKHEDTKENNNNNNKESSKYFTPFLHYNYKVASPIVINKSRTNPKESVFYRNLTIGTTKNNCYNKPSSTYNTHELNKQKPITSQQQQQDYSQKVNYKYGKYRKNKNEYNKVDGGYRAYDCNEMFFPVSPVYFDCNTYDDGSNNSYHKQYQYQNYHKKPTKNPYKYTRYQSYN